MSLLRFFDQGNSQIWELIPLSFSKSLVEKTWIIVHKTNKKFLVNALRTLGHFVCKLSAQKLSAIFLGLEKSEIVISSKKNPVQLMFEDFLALLKHSFPKYAWNVAYIFDSLLGQEEEVGPEKTVRC